MSLDPQVQDLLQRKFGERRYGMNKDFGGNIQTFAASIRSIIADH